MTFVEKFDKIQKKVVNRSKGSDKVSEKKVKENKQSGIVNVPNMITMLRIIGSLVLLIPYFDNQSLAFLIETQSPAFLIIYGVCGVSDAVDGFVARRMNCVTSFGKKLDSASDLIFYLTMAFRMFIPLKEALHPVVFWTVFALMGFRLIVYIIAAIKFKVFWSSHTYFNKATGLVVFLIPYFIGFKDFFFWYSIAGCVISGFAISYDLFTVLFRKPQEKNM